MAKLSSDTPSEGQVLNRRLRQLCCDAELRFKDDLDEADDNRMRQSWVIMLTSRFDTLTSRFSTNGSGAALDGAVVQEAVSA